MLSSWVLLYYPLLLYAWHIGNLQEILAELINQLLYDEYLVSHIDFQAFKFHHSFHLIFDKYMFLFLDDEIESKITTNSGEAESSAHPYCILTVTLLFQYFLLFPNQIRLLPLLPTPWHFILREHFLIITNLTVLI